MADTFTCTSCGQTFEKEWTDEDAEREYEQTWGNHSGERAVVCEDCWNFIMSRLSGASS